MTVDRNELADRFARSRVLITGGLGFIGSNLARRLVNSGAQVTLVDSLIPEFGGNLANIAGFADKVLVDTSDIRDSQSLLSLVKDKDFLFNLAAQTSHVESMRNPCLDLDINVRGQLSILEACRANNPVIKIVFASTRQIYGRPDYLPVNESHPLRPVDVNGIHKMAGEYYHLLYGKVYGIRAGVLRLTNTYGPGMRVKDARQIFLGIWVRRLLQGEAFEVWGGDQLRDFTYVDDVVEAMLLAALHPEADGQIFNLGGDSSVTLKHAADLLIEVNQGGHYDLRIFPEDRKRIDIGDFYADFGCIRAVLGWQPRVTLREGFNRTLAYYREHLSKYI